MKLDWLFVGFGVLTGIAISLILENMRLLAELKRDIALYQKWEETEK